MQKCGDIHNDDCSVVLKEDWRCCPMCGRKTAALTFDGLSFNVDGQQPKNLSLKLRLRGTGRVYGHLEFDPDTLLKSDNPDFGLDESRLTANILVTAPPLAKKTAQNVYICTRNGRRDQDAESVWNLQGVPERRQFTLQLLPQQHARLEINETLLIFRLSTPERTVHLRNTGHEPMQVRIPMPPSGYLLQPASPQFNIPALGSYSIAITRDSSTPAAAQEELLFEYGVENCRVALCREAPQYKSSYKPRYVVGLDFGTRNTSAILRDTIVSDPAQAISFIPNGSPREPSFLYYSRKESQLIPGVRAQQLMMTTGENDGFFIDRLKEHLISDEEPFVEKARQLEIPNPHRFTVDNLLYLYLKEWKKKIDEFVEGRSGNATVEVHHVFSYPVLDKGPKCEKHLERMKNALRKAEFPVDSERDCSFVQEPVAAALYFLIGKAYNAEMNEAVQKMLSKAGLATGIPLLVIDSGGGTTDVVFGIVKVAADGVPEFTIEHTLGLDSEARRFGGVNVTDGMHAKLKKENIKSVLKQVTSREVSDEEVKYDLIEPVKIYLNSTKDKPVNAITPQNFQAVLDNNRAVAVHLKTELGTLINKVTAAKLTFSIPADLPEQVVEPHWNALEHAMRQEIFSDRDPRDVYVILVGGNTHLRAIGEKCNAMFSESKIIDLSVLLKYNLPALSKDDKMLAVAGGTVWYYGARINNLTPYATELHLQKYYADGQPMTELLSRREAGMVTAAIPDEKLRDLSGVQQAEIIISAEYESAAGRVHNILIPRHLYSENMQFFITYTPARIQVQGPDKQILGDYLF